MFNARYGFTRYWRIIIITNYYFYVCLFDCLIFFLLWTWILKLCVCAQLIFMKGYLQIHLRIYNLNPQLCIKSCGDYAIRVIILCHDLIGLTDSKHWKSIFCFSKGKHHKRLMCCKMSKGCTCYSDYIMLSVKCPKCVHYCNFPTTVFGFRVSSVERCLKCKT